MKNGNDLVKVQNRDNGSVGYTIPDLNNLHRTYQPNETKNITDRSFIVEASVDFENLETVLVITNQ